MAAMANGSMMLIGQMALVQLALVVGGVLLVAAALHDVAARTIPNWVSLALCGLGVLLRCLDGKNSLLAGLSLGLLVFAVATFCWKRGWMGGGDVKLLSAAAIFVPPPHVGDMLIAVTLAGGVVGLIYLLGRSLLSRNVRPAGARPRRLLARVLRVERRRLGRGGPLPYASAIAAGTLLVIFAG
jgi:prepilin peptidase CpaA